MPPSYLLLSTLIFFPLKPHPGAGPKTNLLQTEVPFPDLLPHCLKGNLISHLLWAGRSWSWCGGHQASQQRAGGLALRSRSEGRGSRIGPSPLLHLLLSVFQGQGQIISACLSFPGNLCPESQDSDSTVVLSLPHLCAHKNTQIHAYTHAQTNTHIHGLQLWILRPQKGLISPDVPPEGQSKAQFLCL